MESEPAIYSFLLIVLTLLISAFFSGTEIAYISANRLKIALLKEEGSKIGRILYRFYDQPSQFLGTMLIGNNIALVIFGMLLESSLIEPIDAILPPALQQEFFRLLLITLFSTAIVLIFGEFFPKILFRLYASKILSFIAYPLLIIRFLLAPIVWFTVNLSEFLLKKVLKVPFEDNHQNFTRLELAHYIKDIQTKDTDEIDTEMFENALYLTKTTVRQCMIKKEDIESIEVSAAIQTLTKKFVTTKMSRLLVFNGNTDNIIGYVHHLQLLKKPRTIREMVLSIPFVPEQMPVKDLLNQLLQAKSNIACVKNYNGATVGVITLEDILEEIFGEIEDEHD